MLSLLKACGGRMLLSFLGRSCCLPGSWRGSLGMRPEGMF